MPDCELTDDQVLAELRTGTTAQDDIERAAWLRPECASDTWVRAILRRLALARREARELREQPCRVVGRVTQHCATCAEAVREAVAREREACAAEADAAADAMSAGSKPWHTCDHEQDVRWLAECIRARGGGNG